MATLAFVVLGLLVGLLGFLTGLVLLLMIAPLFKSDLMNDPDNPNKFALFTAVEPGRAKVKMHGGRAVGVIRGKREGERIEWSKNPFWAGYQKYVYKYFGLYVIGVPFIQTLYTYKLPRYRTVEVNGKKEFKVVPENSPGFNTDHVRNELTTWYFQFSGAEVDTIPFTVKGSVQIRILEGREMDALFKTDSWNVLLDQALNSVMRGIMRADVHLDQIIGTAGVEIAGTPVSTTSAYKDVQEKLSLGLHAYAIELEDGKTKLSLRDLLGLEIAKVDIIDFSPDLEGDALAALHIAALKQQAARGRVIEGKGEAEYQTKLLEALNAHPEFAKQSLWAEAYVKAASKGSLDALAAGFIKKQVKKE